MALAARAEKSPHRATLFPFATTTATGTAPGGGILPRRLKNS
jgi:hypothetical protein